MKVLTAYNNAYRELGSECVASANEFGYDTVVHQISDSFQVEKMSDGYTSMAVFKPQVIYDALKAYNEPILWLDADTEMLKQPDFGDMKEFDIAVAVRKKQHEVVFDRASYRQGWYNAGVILLNNTDITIRFMELWKYLTAWKRNDQLSLNILLSGHFPHFYNDPIRIKKLPYTYNDSEPDDNTIIHHKKVSRSQKKNGDQ